MCGVARHKSGPPCAGSLQLNKHTPYCREGLVNLHQRICKIFVDDGITHSLEAKDHNYDLASVLKRLVANFISLKASKSVWGTTKLPVLGHEVRAKEGITADPDKVKAILQTKKPDLSTEMRSFI